MTRQEFIKKALEFRREGKSYASDLTCRNIHPEDCSGCPYSENIYACHDMYTDDLLDRIIELEDVVQVLSGAEKGEHHETNLEHYYYAYEYMSTTQNLNDVYERIAVEFKEGAYVSYIKSNVGILDWLLAPYEEPKYQMTQLCYDMIARWKEEKKIFIADDDTLSRLSIRRILSELNLYDESWEDVTIKDLLENAEVVEE